MSVHRIPGDQARDHVVDPDQVNQVLDPDPSQDPEGNQIVFISCMLYLS